MNNSNLDETIRKFTEIMVEKIKQIESNWEKPWFNSYMGEPQNLYGRTYNGFNSAMLDLVMDHYEYDIPIFMTAAQAAMEHVKILKYQYPTTVVYWPTEVYNPDTGKCISMEEYKKLDRNESREYEYGPHMKTHYVYNIEQTNYPEIYPEIWEKIKERFLQKDLMDEKGMYKSPLLDLLLKHQKWICPIKTEAGNKSYYSFKNNEIIVPQKNQYLAGEKFYITILHEMAHSTRRENYLNRKTGVFGTREYAREELVAELTSAVCGKELGIYPNVSEENAMYLKLWLKEIRNSPEHLFSVLTDVGKASSFIKERIMEMKQFLSLEERFINASILGDKNELNELKKTGYNPTLKEIDVLNQNAKDIMTIKAVKEVFNIDLNPERLNIEYGKTNMQNYIGQSNSLGV